MVPDDHVTKILKELGLEDEAQAAEFWQKLNQNIRRRVKGILHFSASDQEVSNVVQSAWGSTFRYLQHGKHLDHSIGIQTQDNLSALVLQVAVRKAFKSKKAKLAEREHMSTGQLIEEFQGVDITSDLESLIQVLKEKLQNDELAIRVLEMCLYQSERKTQQKIADSCGSSIATIERKIKLIKVTIMELFD